MGYFNIDLNLIIETDNISLILPEIRVDYGDILVIAIITKYNVSDVLILRYNI